MDYAKFGSTHIILEEMQDSENLLTFGLYSRRRCIHDLFINELKSRERKKAVCRTLEIMSLLVFTASFRLVKSNTHCFFCVAYSYFSIMDEKFRIPHRILVSKLVQCIAKIGEEMTILPLLEYLNEKDRSRLNFNMWAKEKINLNRCVRVLPHESVTNAFLVQKARLVS